MDFELTISGLTILSLQSDADQPVEPKAADVFCPDACHHHPRLSYLPSQVIAEVVADMVIDTVGGRIASLPLQDMALEISFGTPNGSPFELQWGTGTASAPLLENSLNWIPTLQDVGFTGFDVGERGTLPKGAATRVSLPEGEIFARNIIRTPEGSGYLLWYFPGTKITKALANEMVFRARGVEDLIVKRDGKKLLTSKVAANETLRMSLANDISQVVKDYNSPQAKLDHLEHLAPLCTATMPFQAPYVAGSVPGTLPQRTIKPICNGVIHRYR